MPLTEQSQAARAGHIGTSELGAVAGLDPFRSPYRVWERIVLGTEQPESERMRLGSALEQPVLRLWAAQTGRKVYHNRYTRQRGILASTADGYVPAERALVEVKVTGSWALWGAGIPEHIRLQAIGQSWVYQRPRVYVVVLIAGTALREYLVEPTRTERKGVRDMAQAFWDAHIQTGEIPLPMLPDELAPYLRLLQGVNPEKRRAATDDEQALALAYLQTRRAYVAAKQVTDAARQGLLEAIRQDPRQQVVGDGWTYEVTESDRVVVHDQLGVQTDGPED